LIFKRKTSEADLPFGALVWAWREQSFNMVLEDFEVVEDKINPGNSAQICWMHDFTNGCFAY